jgi:predicted amidohydrolase YtcJ
MTLDGHRALVNSVALHRAGIGRDTADPAGVGGRVVFEREGA